jgi:hypothetical protein
MYKKGKENKAANALSRRNTQGERGWRGGKIEGGRFATITQVVPFWYEKIYASYKDNAMLQDIMRSKLVDAAQSPSFTYAKGVVKYKGKIVKFTHDSYIRGHARIQNTYRRLKAHFCWPFMKKLVQGIAQHCDICKQAKVERVPYPGLLQALPVQRSPWQDITMDFVEGLLRSEGKDTIMVIGDRFTKYEHFITLAIPSQLKRWLRFSWIIFISSIACLPRY